MKRFWTALKFLTIFPWPRPITAGPGEVARSTPFFPVVGFCLGLILAFLNQILDPYVASEILSVVLVTVMILITRATQLSGLGKTFDSLNPDGNRRDTIQPTGNNRVGFLGFLAVLIVIAFKVRAIEVMGEVRSQGLLLAPVLGHWAMTILAYGSKSTRKEIDDIAVAEVQGRHILLATAVTLALVAIFSGRQGLWIALWISFLTILIRTYLHRRQGGLTRNSLGAASELNEALALVLFASL